MGVAPTGRSGSNSPCKNRNRLRDEGVLVRLTLSTSATGVEWRGDTVLSCHPDSDPRPQGVPGVGKRQYILFNELKRPGVKEVSIYLCSRLG